MSNTDPSSRARKVPETLSRRLHLEGGEFVYRGVKYVLTDPLFSVATFIDGSLDVINTQTSDRTVMIQVPVERGPYTEQVIGKGLNYPDFQEDTISGVHMLKFRVPNTARPYLRVAQSRAIVGQSEKVAELMTQYSEGCTPEQRDELERRTLFVPEAESLMTIPLLQPFEQGV